MNQNQRNQIEAARLKSIKDSHCIDATGRHSEGYIVNSERAFNALDHEMAEQRNQHSQRVDSMPMYQKDGVS